MSTTGPDRGGDEAESPLAPPIPSFASLRAPSRRHTAMDVLAPPPVRDELPLPPVVPPVREDPCGEIPGAADPQAGSAQAGTLRAGSAQAGTPRAEAPRPAEWPDLVRFGVRLAAAALRLPGVLVQEPVRRLRRLLGE